MKRDVHGKVNSTDLWSGLSQSRWSFRFQVRSWTGSWTRKQCLGSDCTRWRWWQTWGAPATWTTGIPVHSHYGTYIYHHNTCLFAKIHRNYKLMEVQHSYRFSCFSEFTTSIPVNALNSQSFINEYHNRDVLMHYQIMKNWSLPPLYAGIQLILALNQSGITVTL